MATPRASWVPSKTAVAGTTGAGLGPALLTLFIAFNPDAMNATQIAAVSTMVAIVTSFVVAWLVRDDSVSFGRRTKEALLETLTYEAADHAAGVLPAAVAMEPSEAPVAEPPA